MGHEAKNVYVKLGLVKPKEQPRRGDEFQPSADRGMLQYQLTEKEIEQEYQYDEFLEQVIEGKEKNFTIVGEPGAGKSTWLEQIALYVDNSNQGFPICISLASLGGKTLEEYLFQIWLKNALLISQCDVGITSAQKKLEELFQSGKVWLLLDGVDEMRADESPLQAIATQLEGWGNLARVVLTCRSNVWEANPNALLNFDTYRTLHFDDEQVGDFIQQWFTQEGKPKSGEELQTKLDDTRNARIRDLIKNPLRLAMLCGIWYFHQGDLPNTKATLYQQYIEYFYRWKQHPQLTDDLDKQEELHTAFSKLALEAIDKKLPLRRKFVHKVVGKSLFQLAREVGWLNWVYKDAETGEDVYAFFHLTFQEYFAACAIDDWRKDFLNHVPDNPMRGTYRIFEPQWKEVILLWLGRNDVVKEQKEEFIQAFVNLKDGCMELFYRYQTYFLAAAGIAEFNDFSDCNTRNNIVNEIVKWSFGQTYQVGFPYPHTQESKSHRIVENAARAILSETDRKLVTTKLSDLLNDEGRSEETIFKVASLLLKLSPGNCKALSRMKYLIQNRKNPEICKWASLIFLESIPDESDPIFDHAYKILLEPIGGAITREAWESNWEKWTHWYSNRPNCGSDPLSRLLSIAREAYNNQNKQENKTRKFILSDCLLKGTTIQDQIQELIEILETGINPESNLMYIDHLIYIGYRNKVAIQKLIEIVRNPQAKNFYYAAIQGLGIIGIGNRDAFNCLLELINSGRDQTIAIWSMKNILDSNLFYLAVTKLKHQFLLCYEIIWHCAQNMTYPDFYQAWVLDDHSVEG